MATHLYVRSAYTLLESTIDVETLVTKAKEEGYQAVALTDHNVMHGIASFQHACQTHGIQPIYGMEIDCLLHDKVIPFVLLAKDNIGYKNLMKLSSMVQEKTPYVEVEQLMTYRHHCILIVYGEGGYFDSELIAEDRIGIKTKLEELQQYFGEFDVALSYMDASLWKLKNAVLKSVCTSINIPTVALNKIYYLNKEDEEAYRVLNGIRTQKKIQDQSLPKITGRHFLSIQEMEALYDQEDLARSDELAKECTADLSIEKTSLPTYPTPAGYTSAQYLTQLCLAGLKKRLHDKENPTYLQRLKYELSVITEMQFADYFLIVYDFIREARTRGIYVGPGRGSAAGSLVAYCLGITQIDPLQFDLLFERFLNPERITMPDIDTDIPDVSRQEMIHYVAEKYGRDHVAHIVTYGTLAAKQVVRDVGKVLNLVPRDIDMLARLIPNTPRITLDGAIQRNTRLKEIVAAEERYGHVFEIAKKLEGLPRHTSIHAGGIIMSRLPLDDVIPTKIYEEGITMSQYSMEYLEERGLIKMDFLGLRNLSIIDAIVKDIQKENPNFRILDIPFDDAKTIQLFKDVNTIGIFQFESDGMKNLLRKVEPKAFEDLIATVALFRPGPMENIPLYIENRKHPNRITYPLPELEPVLKETYGIMIYQEQIMQTAEIAAGFSLGKADILRRAMSKKKMETMDAMRQEFLAGCLAKGHSQAVGEELYATIEKFAGYGFNKAHSVAYALIAYQMAYLKANYPHFFYRALLDNVVGDDVKTSQYINEMKQKKIPVYYPSVNHSEANYAIAEGGIRLPLSVVRNVGYHTGEKIVAMRKEKPFVDFFDFVARASLEKINRKTIESLIQAGALDEFGENRLTLLAGLDDAYNYAELIQVETNGQLQIDLNLVSRPTLIRRSETLEEKSEREKEALGFCLNDHPIQVIKQKLKINYESLNEISKKQGVVEGFVMLQSVKDHRTRKGDMMAFVKVIDETGELSLLVMPRLYQQEHDHLRKGMYAYFHGKMTDDGSCIVDRLKFYQNNARE